MTPREYYESTGKLTTCPNEAHSFSLGKLMGEWQWGESCWSSLEDNGMLSDYWFHLGTVQDVDGNKILTACLWRLALRLAWV